MKYDLIIFDLGNVTVRFDHHICTRKIARRFGLDEGCLYDLFFDSKLVHLYNEGKLTSRQFYRKVTSLLGIKISIREFRDCWNNIFFTNNGVGRLIKKLKKDYKVYLLSNTNKWHYDFIEDKFEIIKHFDRIILSFKQGKSKPHQNIYRHAIRLARTTPERAIFIDDREDLVEGARSLGIKGILFKNLSQLKKDLTQILYA